jgi:hypothetical protein
LKIGKVAQISSRLKQITAFEPEQDAASVIPDLGTALIGADAVPSCVNGGKDTLHQFRLAPVCV